MASSSTGEDDEEVLRIPVYSRPSVAGHSLYLFQCPLRPQWRPYDLNSVAEAQIRPQQRRVDLKLPVDQSGATFDEQSDYPLAHIGLTSTLVSPRSSYAVGMLRRGEDGEPTGVHLIPLDHSIQLRPSFAHVDNDAKDGANGPGAGRGEAGTSGAARDDPGSDAEEAQPMEEEDAPPAMRAAAPVFRPAQTEKEIEARRTSHAYLMQQLEQEPWVSATLHPPESSASGVVRERLFGE